MKKNREMSVTLSQERADDAVISFMGEKYTWTEDEPVAVELFPINFGSFSVYMANPCGMMRKSGTALRQGGFV